MPSKLVSALVVIIVVMSFVLGAMWSKLQTLSTGASPTAAASPAPPGKYKSFEEAMTKLAEGVGLDAKKLVACMNSGEKKKVVDADVSEGTALGVSGTPAFFINGRLLAGAYPFAEFKKIIDEELAGKANPQTDRAKVNVGNAPTRGQPGAKITLIEYSDFQCPFCARAFPTVGQILSEYGDQVLFAYKHFPLSQIHPRAQAVAEASECARDQGKFWEFHDALFANQTDWASL